MDRNELRAWIYAAADAGPALELLLTDFDAQSGQLENDRVTISTLQGQLASALRQRDDAEARCAALLSELDDAKAEVARLQAIIDGQEPVPDPDPDPGPGTVVSLESLRKGTFEPGKLLSGCSVPAGGWTSYRQIVGSTPRLWHEYSKSGSDFEADLIACPKGVGVIPMINIKPGGAMGPGEYDKINAGQRDAEIKRAAAAAKRYGKPIFVCPLHEPENDAMQPPKGNLTAAQQTAADKAYAKAFRRIVELFRGEGATNCIFVWNMMSFENHLPRYVNLYPGDDVVDWIGGDPYGDNSANITLATLGKKFYDKMMTIIKSPKPFMWCEWGYPQLASSKMAQRLTPAELDKACAAMPNLRAWVHWNEWKQPRTDPAVDYRASNYPAPFKALMTSPRFDVAIPISVAA